MAWKSQWKGEKTDWSAVELKRSADTCAVNAQAQGGKSGGRKFLAILNAITQLGEFVTRLVSGARYGGDHNWEFLISLARTVFVIILLLLESMVDLNPWWKAVHACLHGHPGREEHNHACCGIVQGLQEPEEVGDPSCGRGRIYLRCCFELHSAPKTLRLCVKGPLQSACLMVRPGHVT